MMEKQLQRIGFYITMFWVLNLAQFFAQQKDLHFQHITTADGLITNWMITCPIAQDAQGFLWIGTDHGLHKYDGHNFTVFTSENNNETSISNSTVRSIFKDSKERLWFGTASGLNHWIPEHESFERFYPDPVNVGKTNANIINQIAEDNDGNLWLAGSGLKKFNPEKKTFTNYFHDASNQNSISGDTIYSVYADKRNTIWIGTSNGFARYNEKSNDFTRYDLTKSSSGNSSAHGVFCLYEDLDGHLLLGSTDANLYYFDREKEIVENLRNQKNNLLKIWSPNKIEEGKGFFTGNVTAIFQSPSTKEYWISVGSAGINRFDGRGRLIQHYGNSSAKESGLIGSTFISLFEDRSGTLWIGTFEDGFYKVTSSASKFLPASYSMPKLQGISNKNILSVTIDSKENLWLGTADGSLFKYSVKSKELKQYGGNSSNQGGLGPGNISFVFEDTKKNIWIGTVNGVSLYNSKSDSFTTFYTDSKESRFNHFVVANEDSSGKLTFGVWVSPENYIRYYKFYYNKITGKSDFKYDPNFHMSGALKNNGGKVKELTQTTIDKYLPKVFTHAAIEDKHGKVWISTSEGLFKYNPLTNKYKSFTTNDGLPVNTLGAILEDNDGYLWIGNSSGLLKVNPDEDSFVHFGKEEGLTNNLFQEGKAAYKGKNGLLYFGGFNGLTIIDPQRFNTNTHKPEIQLTNIKIFGKPIPISKDGIMNKSISVSDKIELNYNQNDLTIEYVGLHYKNSVKNRYAYKLEPYETEWNLVGEIRNARYTNLNAGQYTFYVKAANSDGIWNEEGKKLAIIINPPPWKTWWAYSLYIFFAIGFLYSIRKFELNRKLNDAKIQESQLRAEAAELQAKAAEAQSRIIQGENERKSKELEEARELQRSMLPKQLPRSDVFDIAVYMKTATEVGGDYYDFNVDPDGTLTVAIGDATGHGMKAGTIVSMVKALFVTSGSRMDVKTFFNRSNEALKGIELGRLMMAFIMLKIKSDKIEYANAGMPPMFIYRGQLNVVEEIMINGMPLGAVKNFPYKIKETEISKGDTILLLSDGLPELKNNNEEQYGYARLKESFKSTAEKNAEGIIAHLINEISLWTKDTEPDDDITFVTIKVK